MTSDNSVASLAAFVLPQILALTEDARAAAFHQVCAQYRRDLAQRFPDREQRQMAAAVEGTWGQP